MTKINYKITEKLHLNSDIRQKILSKKLTQDYGNAFPVITLEHTSHKSQYFNVCLLG